MFVALECHWHAATFWALARRKQKERTLTGSKQSYTYGGNTCYKSIYLLFLNNQRLRLYCLSEFYSVRDTRNLFNMELNISLDAVFRWLTAMTLLIDKMTQLR